MDNYIIYNRIATIILKGFNIYVSTFKKSRSHVIIFQSQHDSNIFIPLLWFLINVEVTAFIF